MKEKFFFTFRNKEFFSFVILLMMQASNKVQLWNLDSWVGGGYCLKLYCFSSIDKSYKEYLKVEIFL